MSLTIISLIFLAFGLLFFIASFRRLRKKRLFSACGHGTISIVLLAIGLLLTAFAMNLYTYDRLTHKKVIADIRLIKIKPQLFEAELSLPDGTKNHYTLAGDEWRLEARILKWTAKGNLLGLDAQYRLERISGRFRKISEANGTEVKKTNHSLMGERTRYFEQFVTSYKKWMPMLDTIYGDGVYHPMADKAHFQVKITQQGLVAYPVNEIAKTAVSDWGSSSPQE